MATHLNENSTLGGRQRHSPGATIGRGVSARPPRYVPVFDDLLERAHLTHPAVAVALGVGLFLLYISAIYLDGFGGIRGRADVWQGGIEPCTILTYILLVHRLLDSGGRKAVHALRPVVSLDDAAFDEFVSSRSAAILRYQWVPLIAFPALSIFLLRAWDWSGGFYWTALVSRTTSLVEYAAIGSAIYLIVARNRFFTLLLRQPTKVDIFNPAPVTSMGRWGLSVAAAIMGGVTLSILLVGDARDVLSIDHLPMYLLATVVAVLAFFGSLSGAHRVLAHAKERELSAIRANLSDMYIELKKRTQEGNPQGVGETAGMTNTITAWLGYERRVSQAQEWPYTANTLRALFASVLLPLIVTTIQQIIIWWR